MTHAEISLWPMWCWRMNLLDLMDCETFSGKMSPASSTRPTTPSGVSWARLSEANAPSLVLKGEDGPTSVWLGDHGRGPRGSFAMLNSSVWPNDASVCSLSQILETGPIPQKYYLSPKACAGIIRRAEKRGKALPELLARALKAVADLEPTLTSTEDSSPLSGGGNRSGPVEQAATLTARGQKCDFEVETFVAHSLRGKGFDASEDGTGRGTPIVPIAFNSSGQGWWDVANERAATLRAQDSITKADTILAFTSKDYVADATDNLAPTMRSMGHDQSHANGGGQLAVAFAIQERAVSENPNAGPDGMGVREGVAYTLEARSKTQAVAFAQNTRDEVRLQNGDGSISGALSSQPGMNQTTYVAQAFDLRGRDGGAQFEGPHETANIRAASGGSSRSYVAERWAVRRLTPGECEKLQGVPPGWTMIPWRGKPADQCPDGNRYRALGNSWAVPVVRWIGERLTNALLKDDKFQTGDQIRPSPPSKEKTPISPKSDEHPHDPSRSEKHGD